MKFPRIFQRAKAPVTRYSPEDHEAILKHTERCFGTVEGVLQDMKINDIPVDMLVIPPASGCDYYTIVTHGMGAKPMHLPQDVSEEVPAMAELVMRLPRTWDVHSTAAQHRWPFAMLKTIAHVPIDIDTWLGIGNVLDFGNLYTQHTDFTAAMLLSAPPRHGEDATLTLPDSRKVGFYLVLPLRAEEVALVNDAGPGAFFDETQDFYYGAQDPFAPVNPERPTMLESDLVDTDESHVEALEEKHLPVDSIAACSHLAIYLRWMIEHKLTSAIFDDAHADMVNAIRTGKYASDLRIYLRHKLNSCILLRYFCKEGQEFTRAYYYFDENAENIYPGHVDQHALEHFGEEKYHCDEFQDEAYLFVPWDETYYQAMARKIDAAYRSWKHR